MKIDVVLLTWNDGPLLAAAVGSALASTSVDVRVIVVDNGSDPPAVALGDDRVLLVRNAENRGVARARRQGVEIGDAPLICLLDSDARLEPGCLSLLAGAVLADDTVAMAVPVFTGQRPEASAGRAPTVGRKLARGLGLTATYAPARHRAVATTPLWDVEFGIGACQLFRRDAYTTIGGLDPSIFYGPEDVDFCLRLGYAGKRVVQVGDARCFHPPRRANRQLLTHRGLAHGVAVLRHLCRQRGYRRGAAAR
jgi:GT2 family glycosyltransferase